MGKICYMRHSSLTSLRLIHQDQMLNNILFYTHTVKLIGVKQPYIISDVSS